MTQSTVSDNQVSQLPWRVELGAFVYVIDARGEIVATVDNEDRATAITNAVNGYHARAAALKHQAVLLDVWGAQEEMAGRDCRFLRDRVTELFALAEGR